MIRLVAGRLLTLPLVLGAVAVMTFLMAAASPFDPIRAYVGAETVVDQETRDHIAQAWGLDRPLPEQMARWLGRLVQGDLGRSHLFGGQPVRDLLLDRAPASLLLMGSAMALVLVGGLVAGTLAAAFRDSWFDWLVRGASHLNIAAPSFWVALLALYLFSIELGWLPGAGMSDLRSTGAPRVDLEHLILPASVLAVTQHAWFTLYVRNTLLEVLREDYVRYARSHGMGRWRIMFRHALPNALIPFVTLAGVHVSELLGGSVLIESIFGWPGLGTLVRDAALGVDLPVLVAVTLGSSVLVVAGNLLADVGYRLLDPRVREGLP
ncbi:MAG TPA: ABC transporter permease [Dehalococcoidia bacterium]